MAKVDLTINGRKYALSCDDGEEARLERLGKRLDERVTMLANQFGQIGDVRLLVMVGITLMDEFHDAEYMASKKAERLTADVRKVGEDAIDEARTGQAMAASRLLEAAHRIETLSGKLSGSR
ncbi:MAG: cell division protein ZapA [Hyphomonadaceae bacterium]|nr:cell division protein ZapA [Hyphomonadaceae bacterium]MBC6412664.1 cell division protein ZapA [Hyphomonadaceae bacterium]